MYDEDYYMEDYVGGGEVTVYDDGSWEQYFADGSTIGGDTPSGPVVYTNPWGETEDAAPYQSTVGAPTLPDYSFNPGEIIKVGTHLYQTMVAKNAQGQTVYRPQAITAQQAAALQAQKQAQSKSMVMPIALAVGAYLLMG